VLAFPSLYEGFGLPMLDAMSYGIPVLANDAEPMREILGESGIFKPANHLESWMDGIIALGDRNAYGFQGRKSLDRSANYSHQRFVQTVRQLLA
jgi:glycosyltransferase involved in cell wall biosynthesis